MYAISRGPPPSALRVSSKPATGLSYAAHSSTTGNALRPRPSTSCFTKGVNILTVPPAGAAAAPPRPLTSMSSGPPYARPSSPTSTDEVAAGASSKAPIAKTRRRGGYRQAPSITCSGAASLAATTAGTHVCVNKTVNTRVDRCRSVRARPRGRAAPLAAALQPRPALGRTASSVPAQRAPLAGATSWALPAGPAVRAAGAAARRALRVPRCRFSRVGVPGAFRSVRASARACGRARVRASNYHACSIHTRGGIVAKLRARRTG